jgi:YbgC/YbaW family acyl-CoA thioester hydrolase
MAFIQDKPITISEAHLDSFGHLNHARYFELFEQARWDIITERGFGIDTIRRTRTGPVILEVSAKFLRELAPREAVVIRSELISYERKIGKFRQQIVKADGDVACEAFFTFGLFDLERRKLIDPSPEWARAVGIDAAAPDQGAV